MDKTIGLTHGRLLSTNLWRCTKLFRDIVQHTAHSDFFGKQHAVWDIRSSSGYYYMTESAPEICYTEEACITKTIIVPSVLKSMKKLWLIYSGTASLHWCAGILLHPIRIRACRPMMKSTSHWNHSPRNLLWIPLSWDAEYLDDKKWQDLQKSHTISE